jgi:hypothetical protein
MRFWERAWIRLTTLVVLVPILLSAASVVYGNPFWSQLLVLLVWASLVYGAYLAVSLVVDGLARLVVRKTTAQASAARWRLFLTWAVLMVSDTVLRGLGLQIQNNRPDVQTAFFAIAISMAVLVAAVFGGVGRSTTVNGTRALLIECAESLRWSIGGLSVALYGIALPAGAPDRLSEVHLLIATAAVFGSVVTLLNDLLPDSKESAVPTVDLSASQTS